MTTSLRFFNYEKAFDYYCNLIDKMRQGNNSQSKIIAKPTLILSIIKLIEDGKSINHFSYDELGEVYLKIFKQHFMEARQENLTPLCYPYYYLRTDTFWHLVWRNAETRTESPSTAWIKRNTKYAFIDQELWILLSHEPYRNKMKQFILEEKIKKTIKDSNKSVFDKLFQFLMVV